jgi:predicted MPP superfamily phosphohydrolase
MVEPRRSPALALLLALACSSRAATVQQRAPLSVDAPVVRDSGAPDAPVESVQLAPIVMPENSDWQVTFAVASDFHFGFGDVEKSHERLVGSLNGIAEIRYPGYLAKTVGHDRVGTLAGLLVTGDLTEWGTHEQWDAFNTFYGANGKLQLPVFEVIGNHDHASGEHVNAQVAARHGGQRYYSFQWEGLHLVALNEAPGDEGLAFLAKDLERVPMAMPIVVYFHLALAGPWSKGWWFLDGGYPDRLAEILRPRNVAAIFHGHHHVTEHYTWKGFDVYKPGPVKDGNGLYSLVHVNAKQMTVATFSSVQNTFVSAHMKKLKP